jgi:hypothetical protein
VNLLADTPPTIIPILMLFFSALASPVIVIWAVVLSCRSSSRPYGFTVIVAGLVGALICCAIWTMIARFGHAPISSIDATTWLGLIAGGFGALGGFALIVGYTSGVFRT